MLIKFCVLQIVQNHNILDPLAHNKKIKIKIIASLAYPSSNLKICIIHVASLCKKQNQLSMNR